MKAHILRIIFTIVFGTKICYSQTVVKMQNGYGLLSYEKEVLIQDCQSIEKVNVDGIHAFILKKNNHFAVVAVRGDYYNDKFYTIHNNGYSNEQIDSKDWNKIVFEYDAIKAIDSKNFEIDFVVRKNNLYGAINRWNEITLPIKYDSIFSTDARFSMTIAKNNGKYAIVPDNLAGEFASNMLRFEYDEVVFRNKHKSMVRLKKDDHYAVAYYDNQDMVISQPLFDSIDMYADDIVFIHAYKADTTFLLYGIKNLSGDNFSYAETHLTDKTVFYNVYTNRQMSIDLYPRKYNIQIYYPNAFFSEEGSQELSIVNLEESKMIALENESDIRQLMIAGDGYYYDAEEQFAIRNKVQEDFSNVTILYAMKNYQPIFSYPLNPEKETFYIEIYEKDPRYIKVSLENLANHKKKTLGYFEYYPQEIVFQKEKPVIEDNSSSSHSGGGGSNTNWMDLFWLGGR